MQASVPCVQAIAPHLSALRIKDPSKFLIKSPVTAPTESVVADLVAELRGLRGDIDQRLGRIESRIWPDIEHRILQSVADAFSVSVESIRRRLREPKVAIARQVAMAFLFAVHGSKSVVARILDRNHKAVCHGLARVRDCYETEPKFRAQCDQLSSRLGLTLPHLNSSQP